MTEIRAVLFDVDGVVVDSEDYWVALEREELLPRATGESVPVEEVTGMNYREIYDYIEEAYGTCVDRETFVGWFDEAAERIYGEEVTLLAGFRELLAALEERGRRVALVSSSPHHWLSMVLDRFDLEDSFDAVVSAEDVDAPGKPEPDVYEYAAAELGVDPAACLAVEDSEHGVASAVAAGMVVVGYRTEVNRDADLSAADVVAEGPAELRETVLELAGR